MNRMYSIRILKTKLSNLQSQLNTESAEQHEHSRKLELSNKVVTKIQSELEDIEGAIACLEEIVHGKG